MTRNYERTPHHVSAFQLDEFGLVVSYQPPELYDREEVDVGELETAVAAAGPHNDFEDALWHASEDADFETVVALMSDSTLTPLLAKHALTMDNIFRGVVACAAQVGSLKLIEYWLGSGSPYPRLSAADGYAVFDDHYLGNGVVASLLWIAATYGHYNIVQALLSRGSDPCVAASDGSTPFYRACEANCLDIVELLAPHVDMNQADHDGTAPVHIASAKGHLEVVRFLCEQGINMQRREARVDF